MKTLKTIMSVFRQRGYHVHQRPFQLNLVGIRSAETRAGAFDDFFAVFYKDSQGNWHFHEFPCTTDPGTYYLQNPLWEDTAILQQGQYLNTYGIGLHAGKYSALIQKHQPVTVIRDYNRDTLLDFQNGSTRTGFFGINLHRATAQGNSTVVDRWSAGCQVLSSAQDFGFLMHLATRHVQALNHNYFSYTLIDQRAMRRASRKRRLLQWGMGLGAASLGFALYQFTQAHHL